MVNFNRIAPVYDILSKMVFGNAIIKSSSCFLDKLPKQGTILFIGGGSGEILPQLIAGNDQLMVDFVELSEKFISKAKIQLSPELHKRVHFIHGDHNDIIPDKKYNAVITFWVVDVYPQQEAEEFCRKIMAHLEPGGMWLFADFIPTRNIFQKWLVKIMYLFFRIVSNIPALNLPDYESIFQKLDMKVAFNQNFYHGMISSKLLYRA
jgi:2-polyprenyl-3-methyl-5-hydroxy-6-metoxy-1,4-benzoquinol methylase